MTNVQLEGSTMNHIVYALAVTRRDELLAQAARAQACHPNGRLG
jgi:hypothetical protein